MQSPGLEVISPTEKRHFLSLPQLPCNLEFISQRLKYSQLRISGGLNRVLMKKDPRGNVMLEDKNNRSVMLHNRRRLEHIKLLIYDVLDFGEITLMYRDSNLEAHSKEASSLISKFMAMLRSKSTVYKAPNQWSVSKKSIAEPTATGISFCQPLMPMPKQAPSFISTRNREQVFFITKNVVFIGSSSINDLVLKSPDVALKHAKLERVSDRYKLVQLSPRAHITINRRRVEQGYLRAGDEVYFEGTGFIFRSETSTQDPKEKNTSDKGHVLAS